MSRQEIYQKILSNLWIVKEEVWSFEIELIDEVLELISLLATMDRKWTDVL